MATSSLTAEQSIAQTLIDDIGVIAEQNASAKEMSQEDRSSKRALMAMSDKLESLTEKLTDAGVNEAEVTDITEKLAAYASILVPDATVTWDRETVTTKLQGLEAFSKLGYLTEEQVARIAQIKGDLAIRNTGGGERAARQAQEAIEGRPNWVTITDPEGVQFSKQKGNVPTSAANLKTRVALYVKQTTGQDMPKETADAVLAAAKKVVEADESTSEFAGFVFTAVNN